jgi:hypothetical protein
MQGKLEGGGKWEDEKRRPGEMGRGDQVRGMGRGAGGGEQRKGEQGKGSRGQGAREGQLGKGRPADSCFKTAY